MARSPGSETHQPAPADRLIVGQVRGLHGLRGDVRVEVLTDEPGRFAEGSVLHPEGSADPLTIVRVRDNRPPGLLVRFAEVGDRAAAELLRDLYLEVDVTDVELPAGTHYWHDIVGSQVTTEAGRRLGEVADVFRVGEAEVYTVRGPEGEVLVPAVASVVRELAPAEKRIVVDGVALGIEEAEAPAE